MIDRIGPRTTLLLCAGLVLVGLAFYLLPSSSATGAETVTADRQSAVEPATTITAQAQTALDAILGPGRAVVTASAVHSTASSSVTKIYQSNGAAALTTSQVTAPGYSAYAVNNGVGSTTTSTNTPGGSITRLSVDVVVDSALRPAPSVTVLRRTVSAAMGLQPRRGDTLTISRLPLAAATHGSPPSVTPGSASSMIVRYLPSGTAGAAGVFLLAAGLFAACRPHRHVQ